jgi:indole-3-glycerol phosphate synthase
MNNRLKPIIQEKMREVAILRSQIAENPEHPLQRILRGEVLERKIKNFKSALKKNELAVIAEIKRRSPSKGDLAAIDSLDSIVQQYQTGGASAISVLTDAEFFGARPNELQNVSSRLASSPIPILRKDFIIDEIQIAEALLTGADAILLIVSVLQENTKILLEKAKSLGVHALVEIHDAVELDLAIRAGAEIIGVNNRNLNTFEIDTQQAFRLIDKIPADCVRVAESGILQAELARAYYEAGFDAVLIGEGLVKSADPAQFIRECRHVI